MMLFEFHVLDRIVLAGFDSSKGATQPGRILYYELTLHVYKYGKNVQQQCKNSKKKSH